jgi:soluble lytic murein transglycosylase-like protein
MGMTFDGGAGSSANIPINTAYTGKWGNYINSSAEKYGIDPWLIASVIQQESGFDQNAQSSAGAIGAMQLMPSTAIALGVNPYDLGSNIDGGTKYLNQLSKRFNGNVPEMLAGYNWGEGHQAILNYPDMSGWPRETQNYVRSIMANYSKHSSGGGVAGAVGGGSSDAPLSGLGEKVKWLVTKPIFWLVLLAGLVFKS